MWYLPISFLNATTLDVSSSVKTVSLIQQNTGSGKNHRNLDVNPLALFWVSSIIGIAVCGCVNPRRVKDVCAMLKFAFPVTI